MGFGTLFVGYFLLLNLTYFGFTDLIAGLVMLMALYKLMSVERNFTFAACGAGVFALLGVVELYNEVARMFFRGGTVLEAALAPARYLLIALITVFMLIGIRSLAREVALTALATRCSVTMPISAAAFGIAAILEVSAIGNLIPTTVLGIISIILLLLCFVLLIVNLISVYTAYMHICMPEDVDNDPSSKPSRFGFVNKFKEHEAKKQMEYAEYKLERFEKKLRKKKK